MYSIIKYMFATLSRCFAYKPISSLSFVNNKSVLVTNKEMTTLAKFLDASFLGVPSLMLLRLASGFSGIGWLNLIFSTAALAGTSYFSVAWFRMSSSLVNELSLFDDGKRVEFTTFGLKSKKFEVKITDILNPEDNLENKLQMQYFNMWVVKTRNGQSFFMMPDSETVNSEVLKEVLKGNEIEVSKTSDKHNEDVIDI
jgi:translation elongation factor EF-1beta